MPFRFECEGFIGIVIVTIMIKTCDLKSFFLDRSRQDILIPEGGFIVVDNISGNNGNSGDSRNVNNANMINGTGKAPAMQEAAEGRIFTVKETEATRWQTKVVI